MWTHSCDAIFVMCSHTFIIFWLSKTAVTIEIFWSSFRVFACAFPTVISSSFGKGFPFPFTYFVLFIFSVLSFQHGLFVALISYKSFSAINIKNTYRHMLQLQEEICLENYCVSNPEEKLGTMSPNTNAHQCHWRTWQRHHLIEAVRII